MTSHPFLSRSLSCSVQIYSPDHTSSSLPSNPSTPVGSPSPLAATAGAASAGTVVTAAGTPSGRPGRPPPLDLISYARLAHSHCILTEEKKTRSCCIKVLEACDRHISDSVRIRP